MNEITAHQLRKCATLPSLEPNMQLFDALLSSITDFAYTFDREGRFTYINRALLDLWGLPLEAAVGKNFFELAYPHELAAKLQRQIQQVFDTKQGLSDETPYTSPSGQQGYYEYVLRPVLDDNGDVAQVAGSTRDITRRKRTEDLLADADRRKDRFLAILAHELRNPLAPIRNGLQMLKLAQSPKAIRQTLEMMERQLGHMVRLIDDLMDASRVSQGKIVLKRAPVDLDSIIQQAIEASRPLIESMNHTLTVSQCARPVVVEADPVRLTQVFDNLLNNACKYMEAGGRIEIVTERHGDNIVIAFRDEGIGIPSTHLPQIFELFTQLDHTLERAQGGLGIGLTLVQQLIELHGGSVEAHSEGVGRGSVFTVRLPILMEAPALPTAGTSDQMKILKPRRVLVVDDNVDAAASLAMLLEISGCETHTAHDGPEAVAAASRLRPEVVLLDLGLPGLNGYEVCRQIREQEHGKALQIIALTGWGQDEDRRKTSEAGFDSHLIKPVELQELVAVLNNG